MNIDSIPLNLQNGTGEFVLLAVLSSEALNCLRKILFFFSRLTVGHNLFSIHPSSLSLNNALNIVKK